MEMDIGAIEALGARSIWPDESRSFTPWLFENKSYLEKALAMDLEMIIIELVTATVVIERSIAGTKEVLHKALDFAFLDVEVTDGKTFEIAQILERKHVPFVFVSGSPQDQLPFELRSVPFIPKPFHAAQIEHALQAIAA